MESKIIGKEYPLKQIFSKDFDYYIPAYQRPYSWTTEESDALFVDLFDSFTKKDENYFLGSIVLIKEEDRPKAQVIDGQQRLTTLTMLIAAIASQLSDDDTKKECLKYLSEPGSKLEKLESKPRLHLRDKDRDFFNKYIQNLKLDDLIGLDVNSLMNESQQHIRENCKLFLERLNVSFKNDEDELVDFSVFLMNNCYMVAVSTSSEHSAFRIFNVMNSRGMDLLPIDKIKSDVIGQIPENEQQKYTDKWEDMEIQTTRSGFNDLFTHIRMICAKTKPRQNLLDDFTQTVMTMYSSKELIDEILEPYAEAYTTLVNKTYKSVTHAEEINKYLFWLNKIENSDWMPSAVKFFADRKNDSEYVLWFVKNLERLASYLYITSKDVNKRVERYKSVLDEMESNPYHSLNDPILSIELNNTEKKEFVEKLNSDIYLMTGKRRNYVMLRLNAFVSDGANQFDYEPNIFTIEHVLPQTIEPGSEWDILWNDKEQRQQWRNKIANLVPLTRRMNSAAKNYDFEQKKEKYFKGKNGTTTYPLTTQVLYENKWTPAVVEKRQKELIKCFVDHWKLNYTEPPVQQDGSVLFFIKNKRGANAEGYVSPNGFVVTKNSKLSDNTVDNFNNKYQSAYNLRNELIKDKIVVDGIFQSDYEFGSISSAASVVLGRSASGQKEWVTENGLRFEEFVDQSNINDGTFNIDDENTYRYLKMGELAFKLFKNLFELGKISAEEVDKLKTKGYTKQLFNKSDYPILANNRYDNMGNSSHIRYRKDSLIFNGKEIYLTTQWFEGNRADLISWYQQHL